MNFIVRLNRKNHINNKLYFTRLSCIKYMSNHITPVDETELNTIISDSVSPKVLYFHKEKTDICTKYEQVLGQR